MIRQGNAVNNGNQKTQMQEAMEQAMKQVAEETEKATVESKQPEIQLTEESESQPIPVFNGYNVSFSMSAEPQIKSADLETTKTKSEVDLAIEELTNRLNNLASENKLLKFEVNKLQENLIQLEQKTGNNIKVDSKNEIEFPDYAYIGKRFFL